MCCQSPTEYIYFVKTRGAKQKFSSEVSAKLRHPKLQIPSQFFRQTTTKLWEEATKGFFRLCTRRTPPAWLTRIMKKVRAITFLYLMLIAHRSPLVLVGFDTRFTLLLFTNWFLYCRYIYSHAILHFLTYVDVCDFGRNFKKWMKT